MHRQNMKSGDFFARLFALELQIVLVHENFQSFF